MAPKRKHPIDIVMEKYSKKHCSDSSDSEDTTKDEELIVWPTDEEVLADAEDEIEDITLINQIAKAKAYSKIGSLQEKAKKQLDKIEELGF